MSNRQLIMPLRLSLGFVWIWTGIICLAVVPIEESVELVSRVGFGGVSARWTVWLTSGFELILGAVVIAGFWPRVVAVGQITLIGGFTVIVTVFLPEYWLHPFGPISKNVVLMAAAYTIWRLSADPLENHSPRDADRAQTQRSLPL